MTEINKTTEMPFLTVNNGKKAVDFYISAAHVGVPANMHERK